jgi:hypothetical protein
MKLSIGDKLEVMRDVYQDYQGTCIFRKSDILTVTKPTGHNVKYPTVFETDVPKHYTKFSSFNFSVNEHIDTNILKLLDISKNGIARICECGADKHGFASHSQWCGKLN